MVYRDGRPASSKALESREQGSRDGIWIVKIQPPLDVSSDSAGGIGKITPPTLLLSDNLLGPESGKAIAKAWTSADALSHLDIRANRFVGAEGAATIKELKAARGAAARKRAGKEGAPPCDLLIDEV